MKAKLLFCLTSNNISGANRILLELAHRAEILGYHSEVFFWNPVENLNWFPKHINICAEKDIQKAVAGDFDFVLFSNAFMLPLALPAMRESRPILVCQGYEGYCHSRTFDKVFEGSDPMAQIYKLPVAIISISRSVQRILSTTLATDSFYLPPAIDRSLFESVPHRKFDDSPKRILAVGDYLWPLKGMSELRAAVGILAQEMPVELVLITQQKRAREVFDKCTFPVEFHCETSQNDLAAIYASCDAYCCASWYEGFGLPCLEAFSVGVPVVCTDNKGVSDFGEDEINLLIASPNNPDSLKEKLKRVLTDEILSENLRTNGQKTVERYNWTATMRAFEQCLEASKRLTYAKVPWNELEKLSAELEQSGLYTPLDKHLQLVDLSLRMERTLQELYTCDSTIGLVSAALDEQNAHVIVPSIPDPNLNNPRLNALKTLTEIKDGFADGLPNRNSELYQEFKARYDLCQIILSCSNDPKFSMLVRSISNRLNRAREKPVKELAEA